MKSVSIVLWFFLAPIAGATLAILAVIACAYVCIQTVCEWVWFKAFPASGLCKDFIMLDESERAIS